MPHKSPNQPQLTPRLSLDDVRRRTIVALAADDLLGEMLVLKGGNALRLVHGIGGRASLDLDYSIEGDLDSAEDIRLRIEAALQREFRILAHEVFDVKMRAKPRIVPAADERPTWGGWAVEFKLISRERYQSFPHQPAKLRDYAETLYAERKAFQIDISKCEYVEPAAEVRYEGYPLRVYSLAMIVFEKMRAICQQMSGYSYVAHPKPRPRDFVDICAVLDKHQRDVLDAQGLVASIFAQKEVPLEWLQRIESERAFHASGWNSVSAELGTGQSFDYYFDRVIQFVETLEALWVVQPPPA